MAGSWRERSVMPEHTPTFIERFLAYGNWSGPGFTAATFHKGNIKMTPELRAIPGVDAYDNFVAKAHDLNEIDAGAELSRVLEDLGLKNSGSDLVLGSPESINTGDRFVDLDYYIAAAESRKQPMSTEARPMSDDEWVKLETAFVSYYKHVQISNIQFAVDVVTNHTDSLGMQVQIAAAPHIFLVEVSKIGQLIDRATILIPGAHDSNAITAYLNDNFTHISEVGNLEDGTTAVISLSEGQLLSIDVSDALKLQAASWAIRQNGDAHGEALLASLAESDEQNFGENLSAVVEHGKELSNGELPDMAARAGVMTGPGELECFPAGTPIAMADGSHKPIERVRVGDEVLAYDTSDASGAGALTARRVTHTFITPDRMILDFHGLQVTPGHVFLCGEGPWAGKHRMLIDILRDDGSIVGADGISRRATTNCPLGSEGDRFVELAYITRADESEHKTARIRAGTLLIDQSGEARSVLQCLEAEGYRLLEDGLVQKPGEVPGPLKFFGTPPKPEDYVLKRSGLTLAEIAGNTGYQPRPATPWGSALASGWTPDDSRSGEAERELFLAGTPTRNTAGETLH